MSAGQANLDVSSETQAERLQSSIERMEQRLQRARARLEACGSESAEVTKTETDSEEKPK